MEIICKLKKNTVLCAVLNNRGYEFTQIFERYRWHLIEPELGDFKYVSLTGRTGLRSTAGNIVKRGGGKRIQGYLLIA